MAQQRRDLIDRETRKGAITLLLEGQQLPHFRMQAIMLITPVVPRSSKPRRGQIRQSSEHPCYRQPLTQL
jgi:hypothetical protein